MILDFEPFSMQIGIGLCTRSKRSMLSICSGLIETSSEREEQLSSLH
jgi:hypothetical protein